MPLGEHVYCVAVAFKMTELIEQQMCTQFCVKLEYSSTEAIWMIQKAAAMGNWWLAASSWQCAHSCIMSHEELFGETSNHSSESASVQPRFVVLWLLDFPQNKITFQRQAISDTQWDSEKYDRATDDNWENCVRSQGAYFKGDWDIIVLCTIFPVSCIFYNKCLNFFILHG